VDEEAAEGTRCRVGRCEEDDGTGRVDRYESCVGVDICPQQGRSRLGWIAQRMKEKKEEWEEQRVTLFLSSVRRIAGRVAPFAP
jgi:hypothetical protein